jgi:uncharacterized protein YdiU (UPF0061 family)
MTSPARPDSARPGFNFDNSYSRLSETFFTRQEPVPVPAPRMAVFNRPLSDALGLNTEALAGSDGVAIFSGNRIPAGADPIAQAYAGHQFGHFTMLGDGRAILLGEHITPGGARFDIQLKGAGRTIFSRRGDGRAALGPMLREYIISEAMHGLGIPTTRSLAVVTTGEVVRRETALPGAVLTRVAASHIRVGTFEYIATYGGREALLALAGHTIRRHYPDLLAADNPAQALLHAVVQRQAELVASWMHVGFIHGVMNTDNMALSGESIDYGPCAFMDVYDPATVFSSIDHDGRYAYGNQPAVAQWNLTRLAETLLPILHDNADRALELAREAVDAFPRIFRHCWIQGMRGKLGLCTKEAADEDLAQDLLRCLGRARADYTSTLRDLARSPLPDTPIFRDPEFNSWLQRWQNRLAQQPQGAAAARVLMNARNPAIIPRNHRVEEALQAAVTDGNYAVMNRLLTALSRPFEDHAEDRDFRAPGPADATYKTFCGT